MKDLEVDFDLLFYIYVYKMGMSERSFWESPFKKVLKLIDMMGDEEARKYAEANHQPYTSKYFEDENEVTEIHSMTEVEGFADGECL